MRNYLSSTPPNQETDTLQKKHYKSGIEIGQRGGGVRQRAKREEDGALINFYYHTIHTFRCIFYPGTQIPPSSSPKVFGFVAV